MRPIKWKGILHRITIWNQKLNQCNTKESALKMGQIFLYFEDCSKSARWMFLFLLITYSYTPILHKNAEKPTVIWLFTQNSFKSTVPSVSVSYPRIVASATPRWKIAQRESRLIAAIRTTNANSSFVGMGVSSDSLVQPGYFGILIGERVLRRGKSRIFFATLVYWASVPTFAWTSQSSTLQSGLHTVQVFK